MASSIEIEQAAAAWLARRDGAAWTAADEAHLTNWLQASSAHRVAFVRLEAVWQQANRLKALGAGVRTGVVPARSGWRLSPFWDKNPARRQVVSPPSASERSHAAPAAVARNSGRPYTRGGALAASVLFAAALCVGSYLGWPGTPVYRTAVGGLDAVSLADGSTVTLNTNSEIRAVLGEHERRVDLRRGEAFFDVAKDASRPFIVNAAGQRIVAVGTKFSVRAPETGEAYVRVIVTEGRVRVGPDASTSTELPAAEVAAGTIARSSASGVLTQEKPASQVEEYLSWRRGYLVFHDVTLAEAVAEFNRYNERKLVIEDAGVAGIHIGGNFRSTNVDAFVRLLESGFPIRIEDRGTQLVLTAD